MASFSLQAFLLLSAPFRKRHYSRLLNGSLWMAYLMADYVATYVLGRLTLLLAVAGGNGNGGTRHQLALFWAPFLLLHLGGQETITAFSMEDNTLWKRRLLDLAAQVAMSVYVVGKQWQGDKLLVAPMVLVFVLGAVKYGERIWALRAAAARAPGRSSSLADMRLESARDMMDHYSRLVSISSQDKNHKISIESILKMASLEFQASLDFLMDVTPSVVSGSYWRYHTIQDALEEIKSSNNGYGMAYKLAEMQVSLIYDHLYTKFGTVRFQAAPNPTMAAALQWFVSLGLTSVALVLFARAMASNTTSNFDYSGSDVLISYILLVGAITMEISSIFVALTSSCWAGIAVVKHLHLHVGEWSGKLAQYNMFDAYVQERERQTTAGGAVGALIRRILAPCESKTPQPHVVVSPEVKKLLLDKVLEIATDLNKNLWDFSKFQGQWALWVANRVKGGGSDPAPAGPAHKALSASRIQELDFVSTVVTWHLVTTICLLAGDGPGELTNPSKDLSSYIMYHVAKRGVMVDSDGHLVIAKSRSEVHDFLNKLHQDGFIQNLREGFQQYYRYQLPSTACQVCVELLKIPEARDRWELIAAVWTEILCYMALNCGATFHAKHLITGGEFLTQVKMLLFIIRLPFIIKDPLGGVIMPSFT